MKQYPTGPWCIAKTADETFILNERPKDIMQSPYWCISRGYATEAELREGERVSEKPCPECGGIAYGDRKGDHCGTCEYWFERVTQRDSPKSIRVNGTHYWIGPGGSGGFGGRKFRIQRIESGEVVETSDLWGQGPIIARFRSRLPDNARFLEWPKPIGHGQGFLG